MLLQIMPELSQACRRLHNPVLIQLASFPCLEPVFQETKLPAILWLWPPYTPAFQYSFQLHLLRTSDRLGMMQHTDQ